MSGVHFQTNTAQEYVHTPQKFVVNMARTKFDPLMSKGDGQIVQPQPSMTLHEINDLKQNQRFDVTALVGEMGEPRPINNNRVRQQVKLIDQSAPDSKVQETRWTFFSDATPSQKDRAMIDILRAVAGKGEPLTLFGLAGKKMDAGFSIENSGFLRCAGHGHKGSSAQQHCLDAP